jgi:hypothetical protein
MKEQVLITMKWRLRLRIYGGADIERGFLSFDDKQLRWDTLKRSAQVNKLCMIYQWAAS